MNKEVQGPVQIRRDRLITDYRHLQKVRVGFWMEKQRRPESGSKIDRLIELTTGYIDATARDWELTEKAFEEEKQTPKSTKTSVPGAPLVSRPHAWEPKQNVAIVPRVSISTHLEGKAEKFRNTMAIPNSLMEDVKRTLGERADVLLGGELLALAQTVVSFSEGKLQLPTPSDFLRFRTNKQMQLNGAATTLRGVIALSIFNGAEMQRDSKRVKVRVGREVSKLTFLLGRKNGRELVKEALSGLSTTERMLLSKNMGNSLKEALDFPDLYECDEVQMADYLRTVLYHLNAKAYKKNEKFENRTEKRRKLIQLLETCVERSSDGKFSAQAVVEQLLKEKNSNLTFNQLIEVCEDEHALDILEVFFLEDQRTHNLAKKCRKRNVVQDEDYD